MTSNQISHNLHENFQKKKKQLAKDIMVMNWCREGEKSGARRD
jgi:hypothetical protein